MQPFNNKVAVVTGGSSGIGKAISQHFDEQGAKVALFARDEQKLQQTASKLKNPSLTVSGDITNISDIEKLYQSVQGKFGKIDILVASAGIAARRPLGDTDEALYDAVMNTNLKGVYFTVQRALPYLNDGASIILISSMAARAGWRDISIYSAAKAGVSMLAKSFSADLVHRGIRVNAISPGFTDTPIFTDRKRLEDVSKSVPLGRCAKPEEIAKAAAFLSSEAGAYIIGVDLLIDGGRSSLDLAKT